MVSFCSLNDLSTELLLKIFNYLEICDLCSLRQSCKRFNEIIISWDNVLLKKETPLVTNQKNIFFLSKCIRPLNTFEKIRISLNWIIGKYYEKSLLYVKKKYIPWLYLDNKSIWISRGKTIFNYKRHVNHVDVTRPQFTLEGISNADVGNFQIVNNLVLSGQRDGNMWLRYADGNRKVFDIKNCHQSDINSVDISRRGNIVISGSRDNCFKIWNVDYESEDSLKELHCKILQDRVWKVSLLNECPLVAVGTSGNCCINSLFVFDIHSIAPLAELPSSDMGFGILDLKWDGPHTIWSCGYDTYLKRWDLRTGRCEQMYCDPHRSAVYCFDYDYFNTIITGTQLHGRAVLWDTRQKNCVQMYYMECCKTARYRRNSPVYSLAFDSEFLFTATDQNLNVLKFSVYEGNVKNYAYLL